MTEAQWPENDMRQRIATLEAENTLVKEDFDRLQREKKHIAIELAALKGRIMEWPKYDVDHIDFRDDGETMSGNSALADAHDERNKWMNRAHDTEVVLTELKARNVIIYGALRWMCAHYEHPIDDAIVHGDIARAEEGGGT